MIISRNIGYTIQKKINVMRYSMTFIIGEFTIKPNKQDCKNNNINNYMTECELKVDMEQRIKYYYVYLLNLLFVNFYDYWRYLK